VAGYPEFSAGSVMNQYCGFRARLTGYARCCRCELLYSLRLGNACLARPQYDCSLVDPGSAGGMRTGSAPEKPTAGKRDGNTVLCHPRRWICFVLQNISWQRLFRSARIPAV